MRIMLITDFEFSTGRGIEVSTHSIDMKPFNPISSACFTKFLRIERASRIYLQGLTMCAQPPRNGQQVKYRYHLKEIYVYW